MSDALAWMANAADILREASVSEEKTVTLMLAISAFTAIAQKSPTAKDADINERFSKLMLQAADVLSPLCPHCGKSLRSTVEVP